jgi:hypothetical protein
VSEFHDPDLRQQLARLSGPYPDDNAAFAAWQRRVGQARRRRAVAWTTGAALALVIGTVAVAALQSPDRKAIVPGKSSETSTQAIVSIATTTVAESSTTASTAPSTSASTTLAADTTPSTAAVEIPVPETQVGDGGDAAGSPSNPPPSKSSSGSPTTLPAATRSTTKTFDSIGGSITVRRDGDELTIVETNPAPGFRADKNGRSGRRIEMTFKSSDHESDISVRLSDGVMKANVVEKSDSRDRDHDSVPNRSGPDDTRPDDSSGHDHGSDGDNGD